jgi:hypothetical protein
MNKNHTIIQKFINDISSDIVNEMINSNTIKNININETKFIKENYNINKLVLVNNDVIKQNFINGYFTYNFISTFVKKIDNKDCNVNLINKQKIVNEIKNYLDNDINIFNESNNKCNSDKYEKYQKKLKDIQKGHSKTNSNEIIINNNDLKELCNIDVKCFLSEQTVDGITDLILNNITNDSKAMLKQDGFYKKKHNKFILYLIFYAFLILIIIILWSYKKSDDNILKYKNVASIGNKVFTDLGSELDSFSLSN